MSSIGYGPRPWPSEVEGTGREMACQLAGPEIDGSTHETSVLSQIDTHEAQEVAQKCLAAGSADEVEAIVRDEFKVRWPDLFTPNMLPRTADN